MKLTHEDLRTIGLDLIDEAQGDLLGSSLVEYADAWRDERGKLRSHLFYAIVSIQEWAEYASPYFRKKHDLDGDIKRLRDVLDE